MKLPRLQMEGFLLRPWALEDEDALVRHANNPRVAINLRDGFPSPYTRSDAREWLRMIMDAQDDLVLAIEIEGEAQGGVGIHAQKDVYRYNGEVGYWLAEKCWGQGIMTRAVGALTDYAFGHTHWLRLFAMVYEQNPASMKVLEKNGYTLEAIHRKAVMKGRKRMDEHAYALLREEWEMLHPRPPLPRPPHRK